VTGPDIWASYFPLPSIPEIERGTIMRKALLTVTFFMISATAQAAPNLRVAENVQPPAPPVVITTEPSEPAQAVQSKAAEPKTEPTKSAEPAKATEPAKAAEQKPAEPAPVAETEPVQAPKAKPRAASRESAEHKARRIAAQFGVYW
jgi:outer membrane biosynthesis protein TonB